MRDVEVLANLVEKLARDLREEIAGLSREELSWQPDTEGNDIAVTVWHGSRWLDVLTVRVLEDRPAEQELWHTRGWLERTGYDPRGIGYRGLGVLTGYTIAEVAALPALNADELLQYLDEACAALRSHLLQLPADGLSQPVPGGRRTVYDQVSSILMGCFGHVGEVEALKAMQARARRASA